MWRLREGRERGVCAEVSGWKGAARRKGCGGGGADCRRDAERASGRTIRVWTASTARAKNYPLAL